MFRIATLLSFPLFVASVAHGETPRPVEFRTDVIAALSHAGCNQGSCHGSPQGKNGFRLSLRGSDPSLDYATLAREAAGRRVNRLVPEDSLFLLKATGRVRHQGGALFGKEDPAYRILNRGVLNIDIPQNFQFTGSWQLPVGKGQRFDTRYRIVAANAAYRAQFAPRASVLGRTCYEVSHHIAVPCDQAGESSGTAARSALSPVFVAWAKRAMVRRCAASVRLPSRPSDRARSRW